MDHLAAGFEAGVIMVMFTNPMWLIKTRLQLQGSTAEGVAKHRQYSGIVDAVVTIGKEEGIRGFYKGIIPGLLLTSHGAVQVRYNSDHVDTYKDHVNTYFIIISLTLK